MCKDAQGPVGLTDPSFVAVPCQPGTSFLGTPNMTVYQGVAYTGCVAIPFTGLDLCHFMRSVNLRACVASLYSRPDVLRS